MINYNKYFVSIHFLILIIATLYKTNKFRMFNIFKITIESNFLHILHLTLFINIFSNIVFKFQKKLLGNLNEYEISLYNEFQLELFSEILLIITFFQQLNLKIFYSFFYFYIIKSYYWTLKIKQRRDCNYLYLVIAIMGVVISLMSSIIYYDNYFNVNLLFSLEFMLMAISYLKIVFHIIILLNMERNSFINFLIGIIYYILKSIIYLSFIIIVNNRHRFPYSIVKSLCATLFKLKNKIILFRNYLKLVKNLDSIPTIHSNEICVICSDTLEEGKKLSCGHIFHSECLKGWCEHKTACPVCRNELLFSNVEYFDNGDEFIAGVEVQIE